MNCREAELQIFSRGGVTRDGDRSTALAAHLAACTACRRKGETLAGALSAWKERTYSAAVPDVERAWSDLRRVVRSGTAAEIRPRRFATWLATPLAAATALAFMMILEPNTQTSVAMPARQVARAEFVEVSSRTASTVVYVDDESGWLVVWASDASGTRI